MAEVNFPLVQFLNFPFIQFFLRHQVRFQHLSMATLETFLHGHLCMMTFLHSQKVPRKNTKIGSHIYE